jgi:hypothetical protein
MKRTDTNGDVGCADGFSPSAAEDHERERSSSQSWDWMDEVLDASFPASDPPAFAPTRIGKPPRR